MLLFPDKMCPNGFSYFPGSGHCYKYHGDEGKTNNDAQATCQAENANLATIHSKEENEFVVGI